MDSNHNDEIMILRHNQFFTTLERLLELPATEVKATLNQAAQLVAEVLGADKVDIFLYEEQGETLVALGNSNTPMGRHQRAIGMDRLPIANGGRTVEVFLTGTPYLTGHADQDPGELLGIKAGLGVTSEVMTPLQVKTRNRGVLAVASARPEFFSQHDVHFLQTVSRWMGIIIERTELVEQIKQEAERRGKQRAAEELLTVMAHDLRNYLTPLRGRIDLLERRARREGREADARDASASSHTLRLLERLIADLLDVARLEQGILTLNTQPLNLVSLLQEVVVAFHTTEKPIHVQAPPEVVLSADPDRLRQVIENVLANAVKYAPKHTPIQVEIQIEQREAAHWALLTITNQGEDFPPEMLDTLLQPFVKGTTSTGLGLGLYLAKNIAEAHGGTLTLASQAEQEIQTQLALPLESTF
jgi:signal transduction histidine kinase